MKGSESQTQSRGIEECVHAAAEVWGRSGVQFGALARDVHPRCTRNVNYRSVRIITSSWCHRRCGEAESCLVICRYHIRQSTTAVSWRHL